MAYESQELTSVRQLAVGAKKETTYGTGLLDASFTHQPRFEPGAFHSLQKQYYSDADKAGKGHNWPVKRQEIARMLTMPLAFDLTDFMAGWLGAFFFGADSVAGAGPYTHLFTPLVSTNIFPVTSLYCEDTADLKRKLLDIGDLGAGDLRDARMVQLTARCTCVGSGASPTCVVALPARRSAQPDPRQRHRHPGGCPQAGAVSIKERNRGWLDQVLARDRAAPRSGWRTLLELPPVGQDALLGLAGRRGQGSRRRGEHLCRRHNPRAADQHQLRRRRAAEHEAARHVLLGRAARCRRRRGQCGRSNRTTRTA
jgi:hypothetical protein